MPRSGSLPVLEDDEHGEATRMLFADHGVVAPTDAERVRAQALFQQRYDASVQRTDRLFGYLMVGQWALAVALAVLASPKLWAGKTHVFGHHVYIAAMIGGILTSLPLVLVALRPGWTPTRMVIASVQMLWSSLLVYLCAGRVETHFHIFGSLAILAFYRDWRVFVPATLVVMVDHLARQVLWPESVYGVQDPAWWRFLEDGGWIVFEDVFLTLACIASVREMKLAAAQQTHIELVGRLEQEMEIASRIQTAILPRTTAVRGLEISARMLPATEVGGDYYEVLPVEGGCWIGIGDVAGHGLKACLVMLQAQSAIEALVQREPSASPRDILAGVNRVLFENVRTRLGSDEHVTMSLIRWYDDGRLVSAGAHEEALIWRSESRRCERVPVEGTWLGAMPDIGRVTTDRAQRLRPGDLLVLYTDGVTEAKNKSGVMFGLDRLASLVEQRAKDSVDGIRDRILEAVHRWDGGQHDDDLTVLVVRHLGVAEERAAE